jgi:hypothetical protein
MLYKEQREMIMTKKGETTMRSSLFVLVFGSMMLAMSAAIAHAQERSRPVIRQPAPTLSPAEINLQKVNAEFRRSIITEMQEAARQAGVKIRTDNFIAIPFDDSSMVFVNAMIEDADRVSIEQLAQGADILFIYSGAKLEHAKGPSGVKLITDIQAGIQAALRQQVESTSREIEMLRALPEHVEDFQHYVLLLRK